MTPENYDPNTNESGDSYQSSHPYGVPEGQRPGPYQHYQQQPPVQPPRRTGSQALAAASTKQTERLFSFLRAVLNAHVQTQLFQRMERLFGIGGVLCGGAGLVGADRHRDA